MSWDKYLGFLMDFRTIFFLYIILVTAATLQSLPQKGDFNQDGKPHYARMNNYIIFKNAATHLASGTNMYRLHPDKQHDLYKYSPSFALLFSILAAMPDAVGLGVWNLLNALILLLAVYALPHLHDDKKALMALFIAPELMTSLQNEQSNGLMAGLLLLGFVLMEKRKVFLAIGCLTATVFIKIFGLVAFAILLLYPDKIRSAIYTLIWFAIFAVLPLVLISPESYILQIRAWQEMLAEDYAASMGISVMGILESWFGWVNNKSVVIPAGILLFLAGMVRFDRYGAYRYRVLLLASALIWMVIFNHKAESPTFIIAVTGVALWYFVQSESPGKWQQVLLLSTLILTSLSPTDLFPAYLRIAWVIPYALKALPCLAVWVAIISEMIFPKITESTMNPLKVSG